MELTIDRLPCDLPAELPAVPGFDAAVEASPSACREGRTLCLVLPPTRRNDALLAFAADPHTAVRFDRTLHTAELRAGDSLLLRGTVRLLSVTPEGFRIEIREGGARWAARAAQCRLEQTSVDFASELTPTNICAGWTDSSPVKFFPVRRDAYPRQNSSADLLPVLRLLSVEDYHPFLHVRTLVERIFTDAGYRLRSRFFDTAFFRSLYLSGACASRDTTRLAARMGFVAGRTQRAEAAADYAGRVFADPKALYNTVGNIVETASPQALDAAGQPIEGLCNNGGCFALHDGKIAFTPTAAVSVGFEYRLRYTTDHRILTRRRLRGFDSCYLGPGARMEFELANRYEDRRGAIVPGFTYRAVVFDHAPGAQYRLRLTRDGAAGTFWTDFAARSALVTTPAAGSLSDPVLEVSASGGWIPYAGDWALYDGFVDERGRTTVELRLRTPTEQLSPAVAKHFEQIFFYGAEEGMRLTLHEECRLESRFTERPGFGSRIAFADVARHDVRQIELLEALAHLFNLRFRTDADLRTVRIEPADDFETSAPEADWSDRTDFAQPVERTLLAPTCHEVRTWCYGAGDGAVARLERQTGEPFGAWSLETRSYAALQGEQTRRNPLFHPTVNLADDAADAPSALVMQVGDRDAADEQGEAIAPRIVSYAGMHPLPAGQRWSYPSDGAAYPLAAFHFAGDAVQEGFTLCFEDRDGVRGLHRYYDRQAATEALRERITLSLRLAPHEFEALFARSDAQPGFGSRYRIDTGAGTVRATLCAVGDYDPAAASVRCTFIRTLED